MKFLFTVLRSVVYLCVSFAFGVVVMVFVYSIRGAAQPWKLISYIIDHYSSGLLFIAALVGFFFTMLSVTQIPVKHSGYRFLHGIFCFAFFVVSLWAAFLLQNLSAAQTDILDSLYTTEQQEEYRAIDGRGFWFEQRLSADRVQNIVVVDPQMDPVVTSEGQGFFDTQDRVVQAGQRSIAWDDIAEFEFSVVSGGLAHRIFTDLGTSFTLLSDFFQVNPFLLRMVLLAQIALVFFSLSLFLFFTTRVFGVHTGLFLLAFRIIIWAFPEWMRFGISLYPNEIVVQLVFTGATLLIATCVTLLFKRRIHA